MSDLLTQDEIDALLSAGLGESSAEEEPEEMEAEFAFTPPPRHKALPMRPPIERGLPSDYQEEEPAKKKPLLRRSSKVSETVKVQNAVFTSFDEEEPSGDTTNLEVILNLDLEIRVELGKTNCTVQEILEMGSGSVLELERLNGEPVDLLVNKKHFSKGEMIVIGENFGVRVTDILSVHEIIEALH